MNFRGQNFDGTATSGDGTVNIAIPFSHCTWLSLQLSRSNGSDAATIQTSGDGTNFEDVTPALPVTATPGAMYLVPWHGRQMRVQFTTASKSITAVADNGSGKCRFTAVGHGLTTGDAITLASLSVSSGTIASTADDGAGHPRFADVAHGLTAGQRVTVAGTTDYNGTSVVGTVSDADHFDVDTETYVSDQSGTWTSDYNVAATATVIDADTFDVTTLVYGGTSTGTFTAIPGDCAIYAVGS